MMQDRECGFCRAEMRDGKDEFWVVNDRQIAEFCFESPPLDPEDHWFCSRPCCVSFLRGLQEEKGADITPLEIDAHYCKATRA